MSRAASLAVLAWLVAGCTLPGKPEKISLEGQPAKVEDFDVLYRNNCTGCHGAGGPAIDLANPVFLAIADEGTVRRAVAEGVPGTLMPGFAKPAGGYLTERQLDVIAREMHTRWARPAALAGVTPPPYEGPTGDASRGANVFANACARCHDEAKAQRLYDGSYLALVSAQSLRTLVIAGRPELGQPDWRGDRSGEPLSSQEVADVVAWLVSHRPAFPGQPYPSSVVEADHARPTR
jgi:cytochrome c oxidase cbb3-type subunit 3/ubiquinol-cytochrome c reductase cytochrome c subunit